MPMVGAKAAFPPLGLLTFAAHAAQMARRLGSPTGHARPALDAAADTPWSALVDRAREAAVRVERERPLAEVDAWARSLRQKIEGAVAAPTDLQSLYRWSREYFVRQRRLHRFPGAYLVKAFNLAIKGLHYDTVMTGIVRESNTNGPRAVRTGNVRLRP
jgi:hypothetical protein